MNESPDQFKDLQRLLTLKRYEQPPPGYFDRLQQQISTRIQHLEKKPVPSFWERVFLQVLHRPQVAYAFGLAACGTLVFTVAHFLIVDPEPVDAKVLERWRTPPVSLTSVPHVDENSAAVVPYQITAVSSTNSVLASDPGFAFERLGFRAERASFR
jgi:hypothetical protein